MTLTSPERAVYKKLLGRPGEPATSPRPLAAQRRMRLTASPRRVTRLSGSVCSGGGSPRGRVRRIPLARELQRLAVDDEDLEVTTIPRQHGTCPRDQMYRR